MRLRIPSYPFPNVVCIIHCCSVVKHSVHKLRDFAGACIQLVVVCVLLSKQASPVTSLSYE